MARAFFSSSFLIERILRTKEKIIEEKIKRLVNIGTKGTMAAIIPTKGNIANILNNRDK